MSQDRIIAGEINKHDFDSSVLVQMPLYELDKRIAEVCEKLDKEIVILSESGDYESPGFDIPKNVYRLYCQGINFSHDKIRAMPLGINEIQDDAITKFENTEKKKLIFRNFAIHTNPGRRLFAQSECDKDFIDHIEYDDSKCIGDGLLSLYSDICQYKFGISPVGNGLDCYRTWEYLYLGIIPVVYDLPMNRYFARHVPMLVVPSYKILSEEMLESEYEKIKGQSWNMDFLTKSYHVEQINFDIKHLTNRNVLI